MDLTTTYLGLALRTPFMPGASPLTDDLGVVRQLEDSGAGAIVHSPSAACSSSTPISMCRDCGTVAASKNRDASAAAGQPVESPVIFGRTRMPPRDEFGNSIRTLVDRGVELHFVYSGGEPDWYNYERQFHDMFEPYGFVDQVAYTYLTQSDHTLTQPKAQDAFIACVDDWLEQRAWPALEKARTSAAAQGVAPPALQAA